MAADSRYVAIEEVIQGTTDALSADGVISHIAVWTITSIPTS
jgi:hypothetical protein